MVIFNYGYPDRRLMVKTKIAAFFLSFLIGLILTACGSPRTSPETQAPQELSQKSPTQTVPAPTATTVPTNTPEPTSKPTSAPTDTPEPTAATVVMPGWNKFEAQGIEIWLPESFEGGDLENDLEVIVNKLHSLGKEFEQVATMLETNSTAFVLWAFDTNIGSSGYLTNMNIVREQVLSAVTLDMYMQAFEQQIPSYLTIIEQNPGQLEDYESLRLVIKTEISGIEGRELMYLIKDDNTIWGITFATALDEFDKRLPAFDQSVQTFKTLP